LNNYDNIPTKHRRDVKRVVSYNNDKNLATASNDNEVHLYEADDQGKF